mmetsp:Transcript_12424/g.35557  ORF Transcript_12424/g.35557 Transcript_12424/m.35557 type:complete len:97 (-) Transcript_12424:30-320(-)
MLFSFGALMTKHSSTPCSTTMEKEADTPVGRSNKGLKKRVAKMSIGESFGRKQLGNKERRVGDRLWRALLLILLACSVADAMALRCASLRLWALGG